MKITEAVSKFSDKLNRFNKVYPSSELPRGKNPNQHLEQLISEKKLAFKKSVITSYKRYRFPYKILGETSSQADEIAHDQDLLLSAYNLFKSVVEANEKFGGSETFLNAEIVSPLTTKGAYTLGDDFVFLQCYLMFEQKILDYIPFMNLNVDKTYSLQFQKADKFQFNSNQKEIIAVIKETFYG